MRILLLALSILLLPTIALAVPPQETAPAGNVVGEAQVRRVIEDFVLRRAAPLKAEVRVRKIGYSGELNLPPGEVSFEVLAPERWEGYGNSSVALVVRVDGEVKRNLTVQVEVEALADMVVAARTLERGEVLAPADLSLARRNLAQVQGRFLRSIDEAVGLRVKSAVRANSPVRGDYLERVPVIRSGQVVTIIAENDRVRVTAAGRARGAGAVGEQIIVQNLSSQKDLPARVVDSGTVKVDF